MGQGDPNFSSGAFGKEGRRDTEEGLGQFIFQIRHRHNWSKTARVSELY